MSLVTPTTQDISDNIVAQLQTTLNQTIPLLPKSFIRVLAKVLGGVFILLYKYGGFTHQQLFVSTASDQETIVNGVSITPLNEWGALVGIGDPVGATQAELLVDITVTNQVGSLPAGSQLLGATNGVTYITLASVLLDAPAKQATVRAVNDQSGNQGRGEIGNLDPGAILTFANPLPNVDREVTVNSQVVTGADAESTEAYRQRIIDRFTVRPQGGAYADYRNWGSEVAGITQVYPYTGIPAGEVDVYVESATEVDGIPTPAQLTAVADAIELDQDGLATRRPAGALVNTLPIIRTEWKAVVSGISGVPDLVAAQTQVTNAIQEYFLSRENFIAGLDVPPRKDIVSTSAVIGTVEDVITSLGGIFSTVTLELTSNPGVPVDQDILDKGEKVKAIVEFV